MVRPGEPPFREALSLRRNINNCLAFHLLLLPLSIVSSCLTSCHGSQRFDRRPPSLPLHPPPPQPRGEAPGICDADINRTGCFSRYFAQHKTAAPVIPKRATAQMGTGTAFPLFFPLLSFFSLPLAVPYGGARHIWYAARSIFALICLSLYIDGTICHRATLGLRREYF